MTGPEHYRKAEEILAKAGDPDFWMGDMACAQAHATLALAAAVAESGGLANTGALGVLSPWGRAIEGGS